MACLFLFGCQGSGSKSESCSDGIKNQNETDIDCGGICSKCQDGGGCLVDSDCDSGNCSSGKCSSQQAPSCDDSVQNQDETDVDCGGQKCTACEEGKRCSIDDDCTGELSCEQGKCVSECVSDCDGKCGGASDGCGGTCDQCPSGQWCDTQQCKVCNLDSHCGQSCVDCSSHDTNKACINGSCGCAISKDCSDGEICRNGTCFEQVPCTSPDDCDPGSWCDSGMCAPCDSDDHCGDACEDCLVVGMVCSADGFCSKPPCTTDSDCSNYEQCLDGVCSCEDAAIVCHDDMVRECVDSSWIVVQDCAEQGMVCVQDHCERTILCPEGQECTNPFGEPQLYCLENGIPPSGSQLGCDPDRPLSSCRDGGFTCVDAGGIGGIEPFCLERCGACDDGLVCTDISIETDDGIFVCLEPSGSVPPDVQTECDPSIPVTSCPGNALCIEIAQGQTSCLQVCSMPH